MADCANAPPMGGGLWSTTGSLVGRARRCGISCRIGRIGRIASQTDGGSHTDRRHGQHHDPGHVPAQRDTVQDSAAPQQHGRPTCYLRDRLDFEALRWFPLPPACLLGH
jgi:hypothetical protein